MFIYIYIYIYLYIYISLSVYIYIYIHIYTYTYIVQLNARYCAALSAIACTLFSQELNHLNPSHFTQCHGGVDSQHM